MKKLLLIIGAFLLFTDLSASNAIEKTYSNNRYPLVRKPYIELPLGSIKPQGWLLEMLHRQREGASGQMDVLYPKVMGARNGWLGGDGDQWERGPYWIDGLLPLAYILDDDVLKQKVQPWIEWALASQREDGYFGPAKDYAPEPGLQRDNSADWWPRMVVLKIMQQYYSATKDQRVVDFMRKYFQYQLATLPSNPLGRWTFWAEYRVCDNLQAVYWLYNITGDAFLLDLGKLLHQQGIDFTKMFLCGEELTRQGGLHCVNLSQGLKEPVIYYQQEPDRKYIEAVKKGLADLRKFNGQPQGMFGGDERLHGNVPTQGSELCSAVEMMFSLEKMIEITGDLSFVDHLEKIAFNALPTQVTDDFMYKQYFQQANQVKVTRHVRNFYEEGPHGGTDVVFGTLSGYPCCFSNMHQGWPKLMQSLWYATPDNGIAALVYAPSEVTAKVGNGSEVKITEQTSYPMDGNIALSFQFATKADRKTGVEFPLHLRIPAWCKEAVITINGEQQKAFGNTVAVLRKVWKESDSVTISFPMKVTTSRWYENSIAVERGPLVYGLMMEENWKCCEVSENEVPHLGKCYYEVTSPTKWNYGIMDFDPNKAEEHFKVIVDKKKLAGNYPWNVENAPIQIKVKAKEIPYWKLYNDMAGPLPFDYCPTNAPVEEITLIPYGCTTLRISEFPIVR